MKIAQTELIVVAGVILYIAFFAHPVPTAVSTLLSSPVGHIIVLGGIVYTVVYHSVIMGIFFGIAYIMSTSSSFEYLDEKEQKPSHASSHAKPKQPPTPTSTGVPPPAISGLLNSLMKNKGNGRLPQTTGKAVTTKPTSTVPPKPKLSSNIENFMNF
jgi:hypothetical protein